MEPLPPSQKVRLRPPGGYINSLQSPSQKVCGSIGLEDLRVNDGQWSLCSGTPDMDGFDVLLLPGISVEVDHGFEDTHVHPFPLYQQGGFHVHVHFQEGSTDSWDVARTALTLWSDTVDHPLGHREEAPVAACTTNTQWIQQSNYSLIPRNGQGWCHGGQWGGIYGSPISRVWGIGHQGFQFDSIRRLKRNGRWPACFLM